MEDVQKDCVQIRSSISECVVSKMESKGTVLRQKSLQGRVVAGIPPSYRKPIHLEGKSDFATCQQCQARFLKSNIYIEKYRLWSRAIIVNFNITERCSTQKCKSQEWNVYNW